MALYLEGAVVPCEVCPRSRRAAPIVVERSQSMSMEELALLPPRQEGA
jgi:hypothetical protein